MTQEVKHSLEGLAFLAELAVTVEDRRRLDSILRETETTVDSDASDVGELVAA